MQESVWCRTVCVQHTLLRTKNTNAQKSAIVERTDLSPNPREVLRAGGAIFFDASLC